MLRNVIAAALVLAAVPVVAKPTRTPGTPSAAEVAEAKASLVEMADKIFVSFWRDHQSGAVRAGVSATATRQMMRWLAPAHSLGLCKSFLEPAEAIAQASSPTQLAPPWLSGAL